MSDRLLCRGAYKLEGPWPTLGDTISLVDNVMRISGCGTRCYRQCASHRFLAEAHVDTARWIGPNSSRV